MLVAAIRAHFVRFAVGAPGRRCFCSLSSAPIAASRARFFRFNSIRIVSSLKSSLPDSAHTPITLAAGV